MRSFRHLPILLLVLLSAVVSYGGDGSHVEVAIYENLPDDQLWSPTDKPSTSFMQTDVAILDLPRKYIDGGIIADRSNPFLLVVTADVHLAKGTYEFLMRSKHSSRLYVDGKRVVDQERTFKPNADGHEEVPPLPKASRPDMLPPPILHDEYTATVELANGMHTIRAETVVGGKQLRAEVGEFVVAIAPENGPFAVLSTDENSLGPLTKDAWAQRKLQSIAFIEKLNTRFRREAAAVDDAYWQRRHQIARDEIAAMDPVSVPDSDHFTGDIDRFVEERLTEKGLAAAPLVDDLSFLRRVSLDTVGVIPSLDEIHEFVADESPDRRANAIDRLLDDSRWADHWVPYWQDVLAENPNILKPSLNNTGPFREWIYESFLDNKPLDRFATDLILMRGSKYTGGPAGFSMATQNDVPEANKALILTRAFLAANMDCARCHDSPTNDFSQKQLFSIAAMLKRGAIELPESSTVAFDEAARRPAIEVSLSPGDYILPHWRLSELADDNLPSGVLRDADNPREWLAAIVTSPRNRRFARVMANRIWHRYMGRGLIEPVDDWTDEAPTHPQLLDYLEGQLVESGYDVKHLARMILNSETYQRQVLADDSRERLAGEPWYASATRRRMTAEQIFDSLVAITGKDVHAERLTMDPEGRRPVSSFLNLGVPKRAWQFSSLSNERDRPALSLPVAQSVNDLLKAFSWRESRQDPTTNRDETTTALQPLVLANGVIGRRIVGLSDDHAVTELCISEVPLAELIDSLYMTFYTRPPTPSQSAAVFETLSEGFANRVNRDVSPVDDAYDWQLHAVSWSNHLHPEASEIMLKLEQRTRAADPPTARLNQEWRQRMEDVLWAMTNSPELIFVP